MSGQSIAVTVQTNAPALARALRYLAMEQLPFATAVALTRVAQDARAEVVRNLPDHFKIRSKRVVAGVRIERANKKDWPNVHAKVGTADEFMALQVTGGTKRPQRGAAHIAVPTRLVTSRRTGSGAVPKPLKPRQLRNREDVFVAQQEIRKRLGKRSKGALLNLGELGTFYNLVTEAHIKPRWPLPKEVETSATSTYGAHFERELTAAIRSARARAGSFSSEQGRQAYLAARTSLGRIGG
jgi:hypothetical protein